jgi:hypothetical protein
VISNFGEEGGPEDLIALVGGGVAKSAGLGIKLIDFEGLAVGIDQPILFDTVAGIDLHLCRAILLLGCLGQYLDHQIGSALNILFRDDLFARVGDKEQVRLNDVGVG